MSKFEVGQKWRMRNGHVVTVVYKNSSDIVVERENLSLCLLHIDGHVLPHGFPMQEDLIEQVVEPKFRPFANAAEFEPHRNRWLLSGSERLKVIWYSDVNMCSTKFWCWKEAFHKFTFEDGTPFGVRVS